MISVMPIAPQLQVIRSGLVTWIDASIQTSRDGVSAAINDISGNEYDATRVNGVTYNSDNGGNWIFDGTDDYITFGDRDQFTLSSGFTLITWVMFSGLINTTNAALLSKYPLTNTLNKEFVLGLNGGLMYLWCHNPTTASIYIGRTTGNVITNGWIADNTWVMVTGTYSGGTSAANLRIYINSTRRDSTNFNAGTFTGMTNRTEPLTIGRPNTGLTFDNEYLIGKIGSAMVYNRALSADEVTHNFNVTRRRFGV